MSIKIISKRNEGFYKGITNKSLTSTSSGKFVKHYIMWLRPNFIFYSKSEVQQ